MAPSFAPVLVVANPVAGSFRFGRLMRLADRLDRLGIRSDIWLTRYPGELAEIAATIPDSVRTLVVGGGDGSINEAVRGIASRGGELPALAILPFGTANVLAHELGLPFAPERLADRIARGERRLIHLGAVGDRPFALMVSAGFDADVVHAVDGRSKKRWGKLAYGWQALRLALARRGRDLRVEADGSLVTCRLAVVTTARYYGGPLAVTRGTHATEPGLRLITLDNDRPLTLAKAAVALALGRLDRLAAVTDRPVTLARITGERINMQIDGDRLTAAGADIRPGPVIPVIA